MTGSRAKTYDSGAVHWLNEDGRHHREDGPAIEWPDGGREWWVDGQLHRLDGPALEPVDGTRQWYVDGRPHRMDGPAVEHPSGRRAWWVNGVVAADQLPGCAVAARPGWTVEPDGRVHRVRPVPFDVWLAGAGQGVPHEARS